jgi:hypothetical protein
MPASRLAKSIESGACPVCASRRIVPVDANQEETVIFEAGVVHYDDDPPIHSPDRMCRSCGHRFESGAPPDDTERSDVTDSDVVESTRHG